VLRDETAGQFSTGHTFYGIANNFTRDQFTLDWIYMGISVAE
jgi:hypothetical protein